MHNFHGWSGLWVLGDVQIRRLAEHKEEERSANKEKPQHKHNLWSCRWGLNPWSLAYETNILITRPPQPQSLCWKLSYSDYVRERDPKQQVRLETLRFLVRRKWTEKRRDRVEMVVEWGTVQWIRLMIRLKMKLFLMTRTKMLPWLGRGLALSQNPFPWHWVEQMLIWNWTQDLQTNKIMLC